MCWFGPVGISGARATPSRPSDLFGEPWGKRADSSERDDSLHISGHEIAPNLSSQIEGANPLVVRAIPGSQIDSRRQGPHGP
jgi:hypothetical protein